MSERSLSSLEQSAELRSIPAVEAFLDEPRNRDLILRETALESAERVATCLSEASDEDAKQVMVVSMTEGNFTIVYDPRLPTIAIDKDSAFAGSELVAIAAQSRRKKGLPTCNVILISSSTDCGNIATSPNGETYLELNRGIILDAEGSCAVGDFPYAIHVDALETGNKELRRQCSENNLQVLTTQDFATPHEAKQLPSGLESSGICTPTRHELADMWKDDSQAEYVIKPSVSSQGRGVRMFKSVDQQHAAYEYYNFLLDHNYRPIIEQRLASWPIFELTENGEQRIDWNVRTLISDGKFVGMYIRLGRWGEPVNTSRGAKALTVEGFSHYVGDETIAQALTGILYSASKRLAEQLPPTGVIGADLMVDENGNPYLYELNVGTVGGLQTIAAINEGLDRKLQNAEIILDGWAQKLDGSLGSTSDPKLVEILKRLGIVVEQTLPRDRQKLRRDFAQIIFGLDHLRQNRMLGSISAEEISAYDPTHFELAGWISSKYDPLNDLNGSRQETRGQLDKLFMDTAPLELYDHLLSIAFQPRRPESLLPHINTFEHLFPEDTRANLAKIIVHSLSGAPEKVRAAINELIGKGENAEQSITQGGILLAKEVYHYLSGTRDQDPDPFSLMPIYAAYISGNYPDAFSLIDRARKETDSQDRQLSAAVIGFQLAFAEGDIERLRSFTETLIALEKEDIIFDQLRLRDVEILTHPSIAEGVVTSCNYMHREN